MREALRREHDRQAPGGDAGVTLIETLVSMVVFAIALSMVYNAVIVVQRKTTRIESSASAVSQVRQALAQIDRQVRSGNVLYSPENEDPAISVDGTAGCVSTVGTRAGNCMRVYTQANGAERCVQWQVLPDGGGRGTGTLRTRSWATDWQVGGSVTGWSVVARGLSATPTAPPFALASQSAYGARLLNLRFEALDHRRTAPTVITSSLSGRNTNYGYDAGQCTPVPPA